MHISEGVLSAPVLILGAGVTATATYIGLKKIKEKDIPLVGVLSSVFFVASLIHVPLGPTSVHLLFNGLNGIILGWTSFPSLLVALFLQAILFQFGGLTTLGVNTMNMALPAVLSRYIFLKLIQSKEKITVITATAAAAVISVAGAGLLVATDLWLTGQAFAPIAKLVLIAHIPIMAVEGIVTPIIVLFIQKVQPSILEGKK